MIQGDHKAWGICGCCIKLTSFGTNLATNNFDQKVMKAEILFSGFLGKHNLAVGTKDCAAKLFRKMFPDLKLVNKWNNNVVKHR